MLTPRTYKTSHWVRATAHCGARAQLVADCFELSREGAAAVTAAEMLGQPRVSARCQFSVESERERDPRAPAVVRRVVHRTLGRR
jgi:hypothetical protein